MPRKGICGCGCTSNATGPERPAGSFVLLALWRPFVAVAQPRLAKFDVLDVLRVHTASSLTAAMWPYLQEIRRVAVYGRASEREEDIVSPDMALHCLLMSDWQGVELLAKACEVM